MTTTTTKPAQDPRFKSDSLYEIFDVTIRFRERCCGGTPKDPELIKKWVAARTGYEDEKTEVQTKEHLEVAVDEQAEKGWVGFPRDDKGLFLWTRQVKAMFKESGQLLGIFKKKRGSKQIVQHGSFLIVGLQHESRIYLHDDAGEIFQEATDTSEDAIHVMTAQGPRTALKRMDYLVEPTVSFRVKVLETEAQEKRHIGEKEIMKMLTFGQENGLGASRSQQFGKFDVVSFERVGEKKTRAKKTKAA